VDGQLADLESARKGTDPRALRRAIEAVNAGTEAFAARRMDRAIAGALSGRRVEEIATK
jgi:molecular chaperone HscA